MSETISYMADRVVGNGSFGVVDTHTHDVKLCDFGSTKIQVVAGVLHYINTARNLVKGSLKIKVDKRSFFCGTPVFRCSFFFICWNVTLSAAFFFNFH
ncbi:hypothetical protein IFM89_026681 [Coptis chinensis]|uniref:Uncharacterized protein n=1 Tax=Coptis chinensis TaxID=261450 RepID=A0A835H2S2_9MAGN|nr:hypothetical protein IFM89_026681 [Coptis chinensis]